MALAVSRLPILVVAQPVRVMIVTNVVAVMRDFWQNLVDWFVSGMVIYSAKIEQKGRQQKRLAQKSYISLNDSMKKITMLKFNYDGELAWWLSSDIKPRLGYERKKLLNDFCRDIPNIVFTAIDDA